MRYVVLALALLLVIAGLCTWNMTALCTELEKMERTAADALKAAETGAYAESGRLVEAVRGQWKKREVWLCAVMPHKSLDGVSLSLETAMGLAETGSEELCAELRVLCRSLRMIIDTERLQLGNVLQRVQGRYAGNLTDSLTGFAVCPII